MTTEQKKAFILLKTVIFNYHGLDEEEKLILHKTAIEMGAQEELIWAYAFVNEDINTFFERARSFFKTTIGSYDHDTKLSYLNMVWEATNSKGYISEMEATAMLKFAKDWGIQKDLLLLIRK
jgi:uncharacterized tellurite resistance protein B-like protein